MAEEKARLLIRIPLNLKARLSELAVRDRRSVNREIEYLLDQAVRNAGKSGMQRMPRSKLDGKGGKKRN